MTRPKRDISSRLLSVAEGLQLLDDNLVTRYPYRLGRWALHGSDTRALVWARYMTAAGIELPDGQNWLYGQPNPEGRDFPDRTKKRAMVFGTPRRAVDELAEKLREEAEDDEWVPATAYKYQDEVHVGTLPDGFGEVPKNHPQLVGLGINEPMYANSMRTGPGVPAYLHGLFSAQLKILRVPTGVTIIEDLVPTSKLVKLYPGVPLA